MKLLQLTVSAVLSHGAVNAFDFDSSYDKIVSFGNSVLKNKVIHPKFEPLTPPENSLFFDQFIEQKSSKWKSSNAIKAGTDGDFSYIGEWKVEEPTVYIGFKGDKGLVAKTPAAHHAISAMFESPIDNYGQTLVVQYEVKFQKSLECSGAYIKLLTENEDLHNSEFSNNSSYQIMFGPDKCGSTNKVHLIVRRKNPNTGIYEEKHLMNPPPARLNNLSNLYTLIIHPNQDFEIRINGAVSYAGNMLDEGFFSPSFSPPAEIDDPKDVKPENWVDEMYIPDPNQETKPADWDEDEPEQIPDLEVLKPEDWDEDAPLYIPDPEAEIPEDWDEEEDGEYVAVEIENPECELHGCGPWKPPMIANPDYKGKWIQPEIPNPEYKGEWIPRKIANPDYYKDATPSNLEPIGGIGIEIWTMQKNILFDNFYISHSIKDAEYVGNKTFISKHEIERKEEELVMEKLKSKEKKRRQYPSRFEHFRNDPIDFFAETARHFILNVYIDPIETIKSDPFVFLAFTTTGFVALSALIGILRVFSSVVKGIISSIQKKYAPIAEKKVNGKNARMEKTVVKATEILDNDEDEVVVSSMSTETEAVKRSAAEISSFKQ